MCDKLLSPFCFSHVHTDLTFSIYKHEHHKGLCLLTDISLGLDKLHHSN